jgi:hypothetical protein
MGNVLPFRPKAPQVSSSSVADLSMAASDAGESAMQLRAAIETLEHLDHNLQIEAHKISLSLGEIRRKRLTLVKRLAEATNSYRQSLR